ncbi:uncharacterized protein LOC132746646 [Ruditapes philippinarum]|uniref:uncharacterized protein LOC132746646 n=1 Tax=Ruditapes philippinarum TaxID=129788 RepID=UPI00295A97C9|nr:uncharacterized protein LOC132746646 [Ruditapes philippinarum]
MESDPIEPQFNFPYQLQYSHHGRGGNRRQLFIDYGKTIMIDVGKDGEILSQRSKGENLTKYAADHPVLPLSETAEEVTLPVKDKIIGHNIEKNKKLKNFLQRVQKMFSHGKKYGKIDDAKTILSTTQQCINSLEFHQPDYHNVSIHDILGENVPKWFTEMYTEYSEIEGYIPQYHNYKYAGGCIDTLSVDDSHCYIASAAGENFDQLRLTFVSKKTKGILRSYSTEEIRLQDTIYGIKSRKVQQEQFITTLTDDQCFLYKFTPDSPEGKLSVVHECSNRRIQSIDISPYIPGECVLVDDDGQCYLWSTGSLDTICAHGEPRFHVNDSWRHVQYGSHPRHVVYADQTAVQMFDLRMKGQQGVDLFSLPSDILYNRERIRAVSRHSASSFYHLVATDYKLLIMDERYQKYPVLRWEHMLISPPQYMSVVSEADDSSGEADDNFIYIGSQYPPEVHAFRFSARNGQPPLSIAQPHRASSITDISKWPQFCDKCPNVDKLHNRLDTSLAGIATVPWQQGHVIFQMDSHGEIFHQAFSKDSQSSADITFSAGIGSHDLKPHPSAVERAQSWIESWGEMMKRQLSSDLSMRDIQTSLLGIFNSNDPHKSCCVCNPDLVYLPGSADNTVETGCCNACMVELEDGYNFISSIQKDGVMPSTSDMRPCNLREVKSVPTDNALSKLLMKQWFGDEDSHTFEEIMTTWDKEVKEKKGAKKSGQDRCLPDMTEESVIERLQSRSKGQTCSRHRTPHTSAEIENIEPSTASDRDNPDQGQRLRTDEGQKSRKRRHSASSSGSSKTLSQKKKGSSVNSEVTGSIVPGSSLSDISATIPIIDGNIARLASVSGNQQLENKRNKSHKQTTPCNSQSNKQTALSESEKSCRDNNSVSLFSNQVSESHHSSSQFKIPSSSGKKKSGKQKQHHKPSPSESNVNTASEISVNTGSEDLFDSPESLRDSQLEGLSSEFSAVSCRGMLSSQLSRQPVMRQLFSSKETDRQARSSAIKTPNENDFGISPRKSVQRKHLSGF